MCSNGYGNGKVKIPSELKSYSTILSTLPSVNTLCASKAIVQWNTQFHWCLNLNHWMEKVYNSHVAFIPPKNARHMRIFFIITESWILDQRDVHRNTNWQIQRCSIYTLKRQRCVLHVSHPIKARLKYCEFTGGDQTPTELKKSQKRHVSLSSSPASCFDPSRQLWPSHSLKFNSSFKLQS